MQIPFPLYPYEDYFHSVLFLEAKGLEKDDIFDLTLDQLETEPFNLTVYKNLQFYHSEIQLSFDRTRRWFYEMKNTGTSQENLSLMLPDEPF